MERLGNIFLLEELPFYEDEFELASMSPRALRVKDDVFIYAKYLWQMSKVYVHYGCNVEDFSLNKFETIKNITYSTKPSGGFWASPSRSRGISSFDWKAFCQREDFNALPKARITDNDLVKDAGMGLRLNSNPNPQDHIKSKFFYRNNGYISEEGVIWNGIKGEPESLLVDGE